MRHHPFIISLLLLLAACATQPDYDKMLVRVDSLMQSRPDSALQLMESIAPEKLESKADRAYYALLLTQARDKNYIVQADDSLIRTAVQYYDKVKDAGKLAQAYYLWGGFYRDNICYPQAIEKYTKALSCLNIVSGNAELIGNLYSNMGYLYYTQGLNAEADSIYNLAEQLAKSQKDTISLCYTLTQRGMINLEQGENHYPKAERQMLQALSVGKTYADNAILLPIYHSLSILYNRMGKPESALQYARLNYSNLKDTVHCYRTFLSLGNAYFINSQYDSARFFLQKIFTAERYYDTKADACMRLSEIALKKRELETSMLMEKKRAMYLDSAQIGQQSHGILNNAIAREKNDRKIAAQRSNKILYTLMGVFFLVVCGFCILRISKRRTPHKTGNKQTSLQEEYNASSLRIKISQIVKTLSRAETEENLNEEEWRLLISLTNAKYYGIITYLDENYNLSAEELQICCLYLAQVPVLHMGHFIKGQARSTIQSKSRIIIKKMGEPEGTHLKDMLFSLADKLKRCQQGTFRTLLGHFSGSF